MTTRLWSVCAIVLALAGCATETPEGSQVTSPPRLFWDEESRASPATGSCTSTSMEVGWDLNVFNGGGPGRVTAYMELNGARVDSETFDVEHAQEFLVELRGNITRPGEYRSQAFYEVLESTKTPIREDGRVAPKPASEIATWRVPC